MTLTANPGQRRAIELLRGPQRHTLLYGGARSGKTFLLVRSIIVRALRGDRSRHAILRFRGNAARSSIALDTLPTVMRNCFPQIPIVEHRQDGFFEFPNKSQIWIGGLDDKARVEKILGQEHSSIYLNECSQIPYASVLVARTRLAQQIDGLQQRAYYDLNPGGSSHWTNREFLEHRDPISGKPLADPDNFRFETINTEENAENLAGEFLASMRNLPEKQRKRFYEGKFVPEVDGALWTYELLERCRIEDMQGLGPEEIVRRLGITIIVVAVDPSGASAKEDKRSDEIGIVVAGYSPDGKGYILEDSTLRDGPSVWGRAAVNAYHRWKADRIIAEINFGGAMVEFTVKVADPDVPVRVVTASRGKHVRAEPVSALYENDRIRHVGRSPDRADAMIWALTDLIVDAESSYDASMSWVDSLGQFTKTLRPAAAIGSW